MDYLAIVNVLAERKLKLGMSEAYIARRAKVSQSVTHRILTGKHNRAAYDDVMSIAKILGLRSSKILNGIKYEWDNIFDMREYRAETLAVVTMSLTQSTSGLENQSIDEQEKKRLINEYKAKFLSGPNKDLWGSDAE